MPTVEDAMGLNIKDLKITSTAFEGEGRIPTKHTGDGEDVSPELRWSGVPDGTKQLAVICHDPDAPLPHGFTHWVIYGIPADADGLPEGGGSQYTEGGNDFGNTGYNGPMPPEGHGTHHYYFWVYALDTELDDGPGLSRADLLSKIEDHVIEQNRVVGTYDR
jgi:Raf kinase inhibitor-like YbhB/YbcL family protein